MEIMGLVIIVILIAIGMLFGVQFLLKKPTGKQTAAVKESILAANFLNTMLSTTTDCYDRTMRELLQECALGTGSTTCTGRLGDSLAVCDYALEQLTIMLGNTLDVWDKPYYFFIEGATPTNSVRLGEACKGEKEAKSQPVPVRPGFEIVLWLEICG
jgi:hypothetical protein